jgi:glycerol-3-phosphate cytidylyltransferase
MTVGYLAAACEVVTVRDLDLIRQARQLCTRLVVGVLRDEDIVRLRGRRPVAPLSERIAVVRHLRGVDQVVVHGRCEVQPDHEIRFAEWNVPPAFFGDAVLLQPRRQTRSSILGWALQPAAATAVA